MHAHEKEHKTSTKHEGLREYCSLSPCFGWLRGLDLNQRPLGYELPQPPQTTGFYEPPVGKSLHLAAGNATPAQPEKTLSLPTLLRTFQVGRARFHR
jgi:hypothetical protein